MLRIAATVLLLASTVMVGCAASSDESTADSNDALSGTVAVGKVVTVKGDALRLRRTPDLSSTKNVLGLLPVGTQVRISTDAPQNGFYKVDVLTQAITKKLGVTSGFVYGDFLTQKAVDPADNTVEDGNGTGSWNAPIPMKVDYVVSDCSAMKDDQGKAMAPSIEDFLASDQAFAVIGIDTNTFPYDATASIAELNAKSAFNPGGINIPLRIVKTAATSPDAGFTVTICAKAGTLSSLPSGELNLTVYPDPI